ncbi:MAG: glycine oxidase ThiO [Hyphomonas sp.]
MSYDDPMNTKPSGPPQSIAIIGAGIIGLSAAWAFVQRGVRVTVYDPGPEERAASWAAAGMLAPAFEAGFEPDAHPDLFKICAASAALWPDYARELQSVTNIALGVSFGRTLAVAKDAEKVQPLRALLSALDQRGQAHERLSGDGLSVQEPALSPDMALGAWLASDGQVDNRAVMQALREAVVASGLATFIAQEAPLVWRAGGLRVAGHDDVLIAAGWKSAGISVQFEAVSGRLDAIEPCLEALLPIGGQMLSVVPTQGQTPEATLRQGSLYIVPKADRVIIGATVEPGEALTRPTTEAIEALKAAAAGLCPGLANARVIETWAGVRPGLPDHAPMIGRGPETGAWFVTGHYRNGILLAPLTARWIVDAMMGEACDPLMAAFAPARFAAATA